MKERIKKYLDNYFTFNDTLLLKAQPFRFEPVEQIDIGIHLFLELLLQNVENNDLGNRQYDTIYQMTKWFKEDYSYNFDIVVVNHKAFIYYKIIKNEKRRDN